MSAPAIVQVTLWNSPYLGNFMSSELALSRAVSERLGLVTHFVLAEGAEGAPWLADIERSGSTWSILPSAPRGAAPAHLRGVLREHSGAILHTHFTAADIAGAAAASAAGVPCVWHVHTGFTGYPPAQRAKDLLKMRMVARRRVSRILAVSPWLAELLLRRGAPADRIEILPNPILSERFASLPSREQARERFGLDPDAEVVLGLAWWPHVKGCDVLLDALERVSASTPRMQALLVGEDQMNAFVEERLPVRPSWLRTSRFVEDAAWLFAAADVFVSASRHEGQSTAVGEALASAVPVVMSDIPGTRGWAAAPHVRSFPSEEPKALTAQLQELLALAPGERRASGADARAWVSAQFGVEPWCSRLCALYESLLGPRLGR